MFDVVSNSSPEGYVPTEGGGSGGEGENANRSGSGGENTTNGSEELANGDGLSDDNAGHTEYVDPRSIMVCCWRSMKEVALVIDALFKSIPLPVRCSPYFTRSG